MNACLEGGGPARGRLAGWQTSVPYIPGFEMIRRTTFHRPHPPNVCLEDPRWTLLRGLQTVASHAHESRGCSRCRTVETRTPSDFLSRRIRLNRCPFLFQIAVIAEDLGESMIWSQLYLFRTASINLETPCLFVAPVYFKKINYSSCIGLVASLCHSIHTRNRPHTKI